MTPKVSYITIGDATGSDLVATASMPVEVFGKDGWFYANMVAYPKVFPRSIPAVWFPSNKKPVLPNETGSNKWISIIYEDKTYWSYVYENKETAQFESQAFNTVGEMVVSDGKDTVELSIDCNNFSRQDLEAAIRDFKCGMIKLVIEDSHIFSRQSSETFSPLLSNEAEKVIRQLIEKIRAVIPFLKSHLSYTEGLVPIQRARPTIKGLREHIFKPSVREISSKTVISSYDIGENRRILVVALYLQSLLSMIDSLQKQWLQDKQSFSTEFMGEFDYRLRSRFENDFRIDQKHFQDLQVEKDQVADAIRKQGLSDLIALNNQNILLLKAKGITDQLSTFNPMIFAQNPRYADFSNSLKRFEKTCLFSDLSFFKEFYKSLSKITITNIPNFYERWCLVTLIDILVTRFSYQSKEPNWRKEFVKNCINNKHNIVLNFTNSSFDQNYYLSIIYQGEIKSPQSGKTFRPDFQIDANSRIWVADAKFRSYSTNQELMSLCETLANTKSYDLDQNSPVFIFHSAPFAGEETEANKSNIWRKFCNYGTDKLSGQYGHIFVTPQLKYKAESIDNLIRWLLMIFQYEDEAICPLCGELIKDTKCVSNSIHYTCTKCHFLSIKTQCFNCGSRIWKNSWRWSYNLYEETLTNVRCPFCSEHFKRRSTSYYNYRKTPYRKNSRTVESDCYDEFDISQFFE